MAAKSSNDDYLKVEDSKNSDELKREKKESKSKKKARKMKPYDKDELKRVEIPAEVLEKYDNYGPDEIEDLELRGRHSQYAGHRLVQAELRKREGLLETARNEQLLTENKGLLEAAEGYKTIHITQRDIKEEASILTQAKIFDLSLHQYGPYKFDYHTDGRQLAIAGEKGHFASFNWLTRKMDMELNLSESLHAVTFLHAKEMLALSQKQYVSFYDDRGTELHCVRKLHEVHTMEYSRPHMLLNAFNRHGFLSYLDISLGKEVRSIFTRARGGQPMAVCPYSGVTAIGEAGGAVSLYTPNSEKSVLSILAMKSPLKCIEFDQGGRHMVVGTRDRKMAIYDARNLGEKLCSTTVPQSIMDISVSQMGLIAVGGYREVLVYKGMKEASLSHYMKHKLRFRAHQVQFCPYDEVLGISTEKTFHSIVVTGSGQPHLDAEDTSQFQSSAQRSEKLVKDMLHKIPVEHITADPHTIRQMDVKTTQEKMEERKKLKFLTVPHFNPTPRHRMKGKSGSAATARRKEIIKSVNRTRAFEAAGRRIKSGGLELSDDDEAPKKEKKLKTKKRDLEITAEDIGERFKLKNK